MIQNLSHQVSIITQNLASIGDFENLEKNQQNVNGPPNNINQAGSNLNPGDSSFQYNTFANLRHNSKIVLEKT